MEDVIRENLCDFCENYKRNNCMKIKGNEQKYTCENYIYNQIPTPYIEFDYEIRSNDENYNTINSKKQKNNQQLIRNPKTKKMMLIQSEQYLQYEKECSYFLSRYKTNIDYPINLKCIFYVRDNRRRDLANYLEAVQDILVKYKIIKDDCWKIVYSVDGSRIKIDKENPRVEIEITKLEE